MMCATKDPSAPRRMPRDKASVTRLDQYKPRNACSVCGAREGCLPAGVDAIDIGVIDNLVTRRRVVERGEYLYRANTPLVSLYAIRAGFVKSSALHMDGREQVVGFHMPGDVMALDAIGDGRHVCDAIALDNCEVCEIPLEPLEALCRRNPSMQRHFHRMLSRELVRKRGVMLLLGSMRAEERLAAFLLDMSKRFAARGYSPAEFMLRMTRADVGSYLGLKLETVSRALARLQDANLIIVHSRHMRIVDMAGLRTVVNRGVMPA
jgi:CRP/FNR family transcriptional regulator